MGDVLSEIVPLGVAIAASPFPIIPAILLLFTPRARATGLSFLLGWITGIVVATVAFIAVSNVVELNAETPAWAAWSRISIGAVLVVLGLTRWRGRHEKHDTPAWMQSLDDATPASALRLGVLLSLANPKILLLTAAAGIGIGSADLTTADTATAVALFTAIAASTVAIPVLLYVVLGDRMLTPLGKARSWLDTHNAAVMAVVITVIGVLLVVKGIAGL